MVEREQPSRVAATVWTVAVAVIIAYLIVFTLSAVARVARPVEFMYGEAVVLAVVRRVAQGEALYPSPDVAPLMVTAYTPLYYLLASMLQRTFGDGYLPGRLLSLAATLCGAGLLALSVRRLGGRWFGGLLAAGLFLTQNMTALLWGPLHRVDPLALCLTLGGLTLASGGRPTLAAIPLALAVMTKQTYLIAPLAVCAALWPDRRAMARFGGLFVAGLGLAVAAAQLFGGGWFFWHTVFANANPYDEDYLRGMLGAFLHFNGLPLLAAASLFTLQPRPGERLWRLYFLGSLLTLVAVGKVGGSSNYWLEPTAATAALIGVLADRLATRPLVASVITPAGLGMMVLGALLVAIPGYQAAVREAIRVLPAGGVSGIRAQVDLAPMLAAEPGDVLTDEPALVVAAGRPIFFEFQIFALLARQGMWDEGPILDAIEARRFGLVVLSTPIDTPADVARWSPAVGGALRSSYTAAGQQDGYWLYRPAAIGRGG